MEKIENNITKRYRGEDLPEKDSVEKPKKVKVSKIDDTVSLQKKSEPLMTIDKYLDTEYSSMPSLHRRALIKQYARKMFPVLKWKTILLKELNDRT
jgi:hypothetical protein